MYSNNLNMGEKSRQEKRTKGKERKKCYLLIYLLKRVKLKRGRGTLTCCLLHTLTGTWPAARAHALPGNGAGDLRARRLAPSPLGHTSQDDRHNLNSVGCWLLCVLRLGLGDAGAERCACVVFLLLVSLPAHTVCDSGVSKHAF